MKHTLENGSLCRRGLIAEESELSLKGIKYHWGEPICSLLKYMV